jgi:polar amino acid transport system substrate-binding protein
MWVSEYVFFNNSKRILPSLKNYDDVIEASFQIGTIRGYSYNNGFWESFPNVADGSLNKQLQAVTNIDLNFRKLARDRIDLFLADRTVGLFTIKKMGLRHLIETEGYPLFSKGYPMPFVRKSNYPDIEKVSKLFEQELAIIKNNGVYQKIFNRWVE